MANETSVFLKMSDAQFIEHLQGHGLEPTESEMGAFAPRQMQKGESIVLSHHGSEPWGNHFDTLQFASFPYPGQKDGEPAGYTTTGESSAK